jgi:hypothetical protein
MATRRIKEITNTATTFASDDFIALDGTTQGTRKMDKDDLIAEVSAGVSGDYLEEANNLSDVASLDTSKLNLEVPDVGTAPNEVPLNGQLGSMAYQSADSVAMGAVEVDSLDVGGQTKSGSLNVYDANGNASNSLDLTYNGSSGVANIQADSSGGNTSLTFGTSNAGAVGTRWSIDSSGSLVASSNGTGSRAASQPIVFYGTNSGSVQIDQGSIGTEAGTANSNAGELVFKASNSSGALTERFRVDEYGNIKLASGGAIDFGSGATLDDYEIGSHTTTVGVSGSGSVTMNSSFDRIGYTIIGDSVGITGLLKVSSVSSPVGALEITLPTVPANFTESGAAGGGAVAYYDASANSWSNVPFTFEEGSSTVSIKLDASTLAASDQIRLSFVYFQA